MWRSGAVIAAVIAAAVLVPVAAASNAVRFADPAHDVDRRRAPDVTRVELSNDDLAVLTIGISIPNEATRNAGTVVTVLLNTDGNAATGIGGADFRLVLDGARAPTILNWDGSAWDRLVPRTEPRVTWSSGPTVTIDRSELGYPSALQAWVSADRTVRGRTGHDRAPDSGSWGYEVLFPDADGDRFPDATDNCPYTAQRALYDTDGDGTGNACDVTPFPLDTRKPRVVALSSTITPRGVAYLRFRLWEETRATSERIKVIAGGRTRAVLDVPLSQMDDGVTSTVLWRVPPTITAARFCVRAADQAGNRSPFRCAPVAAKAPRTTTSATATARDGTPVIGGRKLFVLGLSGAPVLGATAPTGADALATLAGAGVNMFRFDPSASVWSDEGVAEAARWNTAVAAVRAYTWMSLRELARAAPGTPEDDLLRRVVGTLRGQRGLGMWRGVDEPWWTSWLPTRLQYAYTTLRSLDARHPLLTVQAPRGTRWDLQPYSDVTDAHGVNIYPVQFRTADPQLHNVGRWTWTMRSATPGNTVFTTLQICSSGSVDPAGSGQFVVPTFEQERFMAYDAIVNGARGLFFFGGRNPACISPEDAAYGWNWTFWDEVLQPLLAELGPKAPLYRALIRPRAGLRLQVSDPKTQVDVRQTGPRELWVIATRHGTGSRPVRIAGLPAWTRKASVYTERRSLRVREGSIGDRFGRFDVHVYRVTG